MAWSCFFGARGRAALLVSTLSVACGDDPAQGTVNNFGPGTGTDDSPDGSVDGDADGDFIPGPGDGSSGDGDGDGDGDGEPAGDGDGGDGGPVHSTEPPGPLPPGDDYSGWTWVEPPGAKCRDGSPAGYYHRAGATSDLVIYLNGGGACADPFFCNLNPVNVNQDLPIDKLIDGTIDLIFGVRAQRQQAPDEGIFKRDPKNPVSEWSMIYVPYCTGDIHAGVNADVEVPGVPGKQQFVGYTNLGLFLDSFGPAFTSAKQVLLTGSSAGGFGSLLNFDRVQQYFEGARVTAISDSGVPMDDKYMAPCLQQKWRTYWGIDKIPVMQECGAACQDPSGGGLTQGLGNYMFREKYAGRMLGGAISTKHDQIIRSFFAPGQNANGPDQPDDCTLDPGGNVIGSAVLGDLVAAYPAAKYAEGLNSTIQIFGEEQVGYYAMNGDLHMHIWRPAYYSDNGLGTVMADWVADILAGNSTKIGSF